MTSEIERARAFTPISVPEAYDRYLSGQVFEPWARELLARADVRAGQNILDVATGPGTVARMAAAIAGVSGTVVASDISPAMLAVAAAKPAPPDAAQISFLECPAGRIDAIDESFDRVLCQQGFQFFPDRGAALAEFKRVLVGAGAVTIAVWAAERPLEPFGSIGRAVADCGLPEPFPRAFDSTSYTIGAEEMRALLTTAGFNDVAVETVELDCHWADGGDVARAIGGTPFGPGVATLDEADRERVRVAIHERLDLTDGAPARFRMAANVARGVR